MLAGFPTAGGDSHRWRGFPMLAGFPTTGGISRCGGVSQCWWGFPLVAMFPNVGGVALVFAVVVSDHCHMNNECPKRWIMVSIRAGRLSCKE